MSLIDSTSKNSLPSGHPVIFFDGVCNLCNKTVDFVVRKDTAHIFRFAALQSDFARTIPGLKSINLDNPESFVLYKNGEILQKSDAALAVAKELKRPYSLAYSLRFIPKNIRDDVYDLIARNRYRWFGKKESCRIPTEEERSLFYS